MTQKKTPKEKKIEYLKLLEKKLELKEGLPHLYGWPWYKWAREFFESTNKNCFLVAANQVSKSSTQIRKVIDWATDKSKWKKLWPTTPTQFWYVYPSFDVCTSEYVEKWCKEFLPRGKYKDDPVYGWKGNIINKKIHSIEFNSGVTVYFKSYDQEFKNLQTSSVYYIALDEEIPVDLYSEINARRTAPTVSGYLSMVFTATLGQETWRATMEEQGKEGELFKDAFKRNISLYDSLQYEDGSPSPWTIEKIEEIKRSCKDENEILRRVYGRFVLSSNRKYPTFVRARHLVADHKVPKDWLIYSGIDVGSGGSSHPGAISFVAVNRDYTKGRVFKLWRGDNDITTAGDLLKKYRELRGDMKPVLQQYDWQSKDFGLLSQRIGEPIIPADKDQKNGEALLNTLFKNDMLKIYDSTDGRKAANEFETLRSDTPKSVAKDDLIDSIRFACMRIPWHIPSLSDKKEIIPDKEIDPNDRMAYYREEDRLSKIKGLELLEAEFDEWNEAYEFAGYE